MRQFLVNTNVLHDIIGADEHFGPASRDCLTRCAAGVLIINPVIYAEVGAVIETIESSIYCCPSHCFVVIPSRGRRHFSPAACFAAIIGAVAADHACSRFF